VRFTTGLFVTVQVLALLLASAGRGGAQSAIAPVVSENTEATKTADTTDESLRVYAVNVGRLYGVYLGNGLIITAAHVVGGQRKPNIDIAGLNLTGEVIKHGNYERVDLSLLAVDQEKLPISLRMRRMPLCERPPWVGQPVIVAIPKGTARSRIMSPHLLPANFRKKFSTVISDVATTGNSGSGVFDAGRKCLLGVMSRKFQVRHEPKGPPKDLAKYFVPASAIRDFIPPHYRF
jgi:hypothetical protein